MLGELVVRLLFTGVLGRLPMLGELGRLLFICVLGRLPMLGVLGRLLTL
jgi:hypothetical protein